LLVAQALLAAIVLALAARQLWSLLFVARLDLPLFKHALSTAVDRGQLPLGRALCEACLPAVAARHGLRGLDAVSRGDALAPVLDESLLDLEPTLDRGLGPLRALGRMATPLAFITIIVELGNAGSERGLAALQRGLPLRMALDRALDALALGLGTLLFAAAALSILGRAARELRLGLAVVGSILAKTHAGSDVFTPKRTAV
jgi:hypothetical protein